MCLRAKNRTFGSFECRFALKFSLILEQKVPYFVHLKLWGAGASYSPDGRSRVSQKKKHLKIHEKVFEISAVEFYLADDYN